MKKIFFISIIFTLIIATTVTKNSTKELDKKIFATKENIRLLTNNYENELLEFNYLSSPKKLMEYQAKYFENYLEPIKIENTKKIIIENGEIFFNVKNSDLNEK